MLIVTPGLLTSEAYVSVDEADALVDSEGIGRAADRWNDLVLTEKEKALRRASRDLDRYKGRSGALYLEGQALLFPRAIDVDALGEPYVLNAVKRACVHQAIYLASNADLIDDAAQRRARGLVTFQDDDGSGSMLGLDPQFGRLAPEAIAYMDAIPAIRPTLRSVRITRG